MWHLYFSIILRYRWDKFCSISSQKTPFHLMASKFFSFWFVNIPPKSSTLKNFNFADKQRKVWSRKFLASPKDPPRTFHQLCYSIKAILVIKSQQFLEHMKPFSRSSTPLTKNYFIEFGLSDTLQVYKRRLVHRGDLILFGD